MDQQQQQLHQQQQQQLASCGTLSCHGMLAGSTLRWRAGNPVCQCCNQSVTFHVII
jgi:hypothetical protein